MYSVMDSSPFNVTQIIMQYYDWETTMPSLGVLIGAGALAALALWGMKKWGGGGGRLRTRRGLLKRSASLGFLHGGDMALQRMIAYHQARANSEQLQIADCEFKVLLTDEMPDFKKLSRVAARMEMSGKEEHAIEMLREEIHKAHQSSKWHEKYELQMLLVEMYIYKGDFEMALNERCLSDESISDARRPLFMMITLLAKEGEDKEEEAEMYWPKFCELRSSFCCQPAVKVNMEEAGIYQTCAGFQDFKTLVQRLKQDIQKAKDIRNLTITSKKK